MTRQSKVLIIGGGQAGLALSYYLTQQGRAHLVLEQGLIGETWRRQRWDSFTLITPNWMTKLPGFPYQDDDPDGFLPREDIVAYLEQYAKFFNTPLQCGVRVKALQQQPGGNGYLVEADEMTLEARNVVIATGAVLVVGSGQSGCQIAEELHQSGRQVYLSTSSCGRAPRRYRSKDVAWWLTRIGYFDRTIDQLPSPNARFACSPQLSGAQGVHDINLRQFAREGIILLGHLQTVNDKQIILAPNLEENLAKADAFAIQMTQEIDEYIKKSGMDVAANSTIDEAASNCASSMKSMLTLDLQSAGISTIIWATGYKHDFGWVQIPVFDQTGYPVHQRGITSFPGLYFLGLHWLHKMKSAILYGVGEDAEFIASAIADRG